MADQTDPKQPPKPEPGSGQAPRRPDLPTGVADITPITIPAAKADVTVKNDLLIELLERATALDKIKDASLRAIEEADLEKKIQDAEAALAEAQAKLDRIQGKPLPGHSTPASGTRFNDPGIDPTTRAAQLGLGQTNAPPPTAPEISNLVTYMANERAALERAEELRLEKKFEAVEAAQLEAASWRQLIIEHVRSPHTPQTAPAIETTLLQLQRDLHELVGKPNLSLDDAKHIKQTLEKLAQQPGLSPEQIEANRHLKDVNKRFHDTAALPGANVRGMPPENKMPMFRSALKAELRVWATRFPLPELQHIPIPTQPDTTAPHIATTPAAEPPTATQPNQFQIVRSRVAGALLLPAPSAATEPAEPAPKPAPRRDRMVSIPQAGPRPIGPDGNPISPALPAPPASDTKPLRRMVSTPARPPREIRLDSAAPAEPAKALPAPAAAAPITPADTSPLPSLTRQQQAGIRALNRINSYVEQREAAQQRGDTAETEKLTRRIAHWDGLLKNQIASGQSISDFIPLNTGPAPLDSAPAPLAETQQPPQKNQLPIEKLTPVETPQMKEALIRVRTLELAYQSVIQRNNTPAVIELIDKLQAANAKVIALQYGQSSHSDQSEKKFRLAMAENTLKHQQTKLDLLYKNGVPTGATAEQAAKFEELLNKTAEQVRLAEARVTKYSPAVTPAAASTANTSEAAVHAIAPAQTTPATSAPLLQQPIHDLDRVRKAADDALRATLKNPAADEKTIYARLTALAHAEANHRAHALDGAPLTTQNSGSPPSGTLLKTLLRANFDYTMALAANDVTEEVTAQRDRFLNYFKASFKPAAQSHALDGLKYATDQSIQILEEMRKGSLANPAESLRIGNMLSELHTMHDALWPNDLSFRPTRDARITPPVPPTLSETLHAGARATGHVITEGLGKAGKATGQALATGTRATLNGIGYVATSTPVTTFVGDVVGGVRVTAQTLREMPGATENFTSALLSQPGAAGHLTRFGTATTIVGMAQGVRQMHAGDHAAATATFGTIDAAIVAGTAASTYGVTRLSLEANRIAGTLQQTATQSSAVAIALQRARAAVGNVFNAAGQALPGPTSKLAAAVFGGGLAAEGAHQLLSKPALPDLPPARPLGVDKDSGRPADAPLDNPVNISVDGQHLNPLALAYQQILNHPSTPKTLDKKQLSSMIEEATKTRRNDKDFYLNDRTDGQRLAAQLLDARKAPTSIDSAAQTATTTTALMILRYADDIADAQVRGRTQMGAMNYDLRLKEVGNYALGFAKPAAAEKLVGAPTAAPVTEKAPPAPAKTKIVHVVEAGEGLTEVAQREEFVKLRAMIRQTLRAEFGVKENDMLKKYNRDVLVLGAIALADANRDAVPGSIDTVKAGVGLRDTTADRVAAIVKTLKDCGKMTETGHITPGFTPRDVKALLDQCAVKK